MTVQSRFKVEVTERDIERAHQNDSYKCVVAQAIARTVPDATHIEVDVQTIRFTSDGERRVYMTPYVVAGYVVAFDAGDTIEPFSFQLRDPKRVARKVRTDTGKAAQRAYERVKTKRSLALKKAPSKALGASVDESNDAAKAAYAAVVSKAAEPTERSDGGGPKPPPRVFKTKKRSYGHRILRVNREA